MSKEKILEQAEKLYQAGKYDKALREYQKLLSPKSSDPADLRTKVKIAEVQTKARLIGDAVKTYREVAEEYIRDQFHLKAIAVYKTILKLSPTSIETNEKLGELYQQIGMAQEAIDQFHIVANYYDQKNKSHEASVLRKKIVDMDPSNATGRIRLAEIFQAEGRTEDSLREYERAAELLKDNLKSSPRGQTSLIEVYEKILYYRPNEPHVLLTLARIYFEKKEFEKIISHMQSAGTAVAKNLDAQKIWAESLLENRQIDAARKRFREAYILALEEKKAEESAKLYSRILQEFGDDPDYLKELDALSQTPPEKTDPKFRQDFETTEMINLNELQKK